MLKYDCDRNIQKTLELAEEMIQLAHIGDEQREDSSCGVLYGTLLDAGFKLKKLAILEKEAHIKKGRWQQSKSCATDQAHSGNTNKKETSPIG